MQLTLRMSAPQLVDICQKCTASGKECALIQEGGLLKRFPGHLDEQQGVALGIDAHGKELRRIQWIDYLLAARPRECTQHRRRYLDTFTPRLARSNQPLMA